MRFFRPSEGFHRSRPISTPPPKSSPQVRRRLAESRTGAIIGRVFKSRYTELYSVVFGVFFVLAFWGSSAEGESTSVERLVRSYIEETAISLDFIPHTSNRQMADINSMYAGTGGDGSIISPTQSLDVVTVNESAMTAMTPPSDSYLDELSVQRSQTTNYTVQEGDLLSFIASDFGVSMNSIIWANGLKDADSISPGQILRIPPVTGVVHMVAKGDTASTLAKKYGVEADRIIAYNRLPQDGALEVGDEVVVPDGKMPSAPASSVARTGNIATSTVKAATAFAHLPNLGDYFMLPTSGTNRGIIHGRNGVDISNRLCGQVPIYAAADGTVTVADSDGYNGGFGKYIKITHPNGTETLYAHSSKLLVLAGQVVARGQEIMRMGTTGRSTGCHLHFEVHGAKNPLAK